MSKSCTESKFFFSSFFFMWSIFASDMCIQPLLSFLCFFKVYKRWTNLSIKLPAPSRDFHFLRSHVSSHSPIIFAKSCQKLHACNWLKTEFRHQNWTLFTSCYALPCDNGLNWFLKEHFVFQAATFFQEEFHHIYNIDQWPELLSTATKVFGGKYDRIL